MRLRLGDIVEFDGREYGVLRFHPALPNIVQLVELISHYLVVGTAHEVGGPLTIIVRTTDIHEANYWFDMEKDF